MPTNRRIFHRKFALVTPRGKRLKTECDYLFKVLVSCCLYGGLISRQSIFVVFKMQSFIVKHRHFLGLYSAALFNILILTLLMWRIWRAANNARKWQLGFNQAFKGLKRTGQYIYRHVEHQKHSRFSCTKPYVLRVILATNSDHFPYPHQPVCVSNRSTLYSL